jgi:predicted 3-demethylubiquinone-9 3-methyltransferase (glyoxalase superfamily)
MQSISPFLWFDDQAEEAATFYTSLFPNSGIRKVVRQGEGSVLTVDFDLNGQQFVALNGGPRYTFSEAVSFVVSCETQDEVDRYWDRLSQGGETQPCGWLKDRFGLSWQVVPTVLGELLGDPDPEKSQRVMAAMLKMSKIEIEPLRRAYEGKQAA